MYCIVLQLDKLIVKSTKLKEDSSCRVSVIEPKCSHYILQ